MYRDKTVLTASLESYILVSERQAFIATIATAFALWLSLLRSYRILKALSLTLLETLTGGPQAQGQNIAMQNLSTGVTVATIAHKVVSEEPSPDRILPRIIKDHLMFNRVQLPSTTSRRRNLFHNRWAGSIARFRENPIQTSSLFITGVLFFFIAASYQAIAIYTTRIVGHNTAHSGHPHAGAWYPDILNPVDMVNTSIFPVVIDLQTDMMFKAVAYAENCYAEKYRKDECSLFYTPNLKYVESHNATCPFEKQMCSGGLQTGYELDTGWMDTKLLGINEKHSCELRMRKVCSPLVADGFIQSTPTDNEGAAYVEYHYGDGWGIIQQGNKTFGEFVRGPKQGYNEPGHYLIRQVALTKVVYAIKVKF